MTKHEFRYDAVDHSVVLPLWVGGFAKVPVTSIRGATFFDNIASNVNVKGGTLLEVRLGHADFAALMRILAKEHEEMAQRLDDTESLPFS